jgi:succinate dehydrogenase/fumarate reductase flavoprotein subunit
MVMSIRAVEDQRAMEEHARQRAAQSGRSTGFTIAERLQSQLKELQQSLAAEEASTTKAETENQPGDTSPAQAQESNESVGTDSTDGERETATNAE